ncbi:MAG: PRC-barrel domain-containing protein, partial [Actinobacteria bacterium]|nr:PRC-barrel domain-containing protein [Actinomycetota bacterium]
MSDEGRLRETEEKYRGFTVYDNAGEKIGKVDELFVDETDREEYIGVKVGLLGTKST